MQNKRWFYPLWALIAFEAWALHTATGLLDNLITARSGKRSAIVSMLNSFTEALLIEPLGRPVAVVVIVLVGLGTAYWIYKMRSDTAVVKVSGWSTYVASALDMTDQRKAWVDEVLSVESDVLRSFFLTRMQEDEISPDSVYLTTEDNISHEDIQKFQEQQISIMRRQTAAFNEAFGADPLPLTLDLYSRKPARRGIPTPTPELRRLLAAFDAAVDRGWLLSLISQNSSLQGVNTAMYDWKRRLGWQKPTLHFSDAQLVQALHIVGEMVSRGASAKDDIDEHWYGYVVRAAVADQWPKHRANLISMFSAGFKGRPQDRSNVAKLTETLLNETPLTRLDIPELT